MTRSFGAFQFVWSSSVSPAKSKLVRASRSLTTVLNGPLLPRSLRKMSV